jgi:prepilin-type N-terminal cleavage/methylation domain-containing protein
MKKLGFTMIELIFVIVILGILAAVAIPKLAATRTDAKVVSISQQIQSSVQEVSNYVTAQGGDVNATPLTTESQVLTQLVNQGKANEVSDTKVEVYGDETTVCVTLETNSTDLKVYTNDSASGQICTGVKKIVKDANYTIAGSSVNF